MKVSCIAEFDQIYFIYQALRSNPSFVRVLFQMFQDTFKWVVMVRQCLLVYMCLRLLRMCVCAPLNYSSTIRKINGAWLYYSFFLCAFAYVFSQSLANPCTLFSLLIAAFVPVSRYMYAICALHSSLSLFLSLVKPFSETVKIKHCTCL